MIERLAIAALLLALFALAIALGRRLYERRNARVDSRLREASMTAAAESTSSTPRIVYFTTKTCVICRAQQEPAMALVAQRAPDVLIERHDAVEERSLSDEYGVLTVPTTAVYNRRGELVSVNRGFATASVLLAQIEGRDPSFESGALMASEPVA